VCFRGETKIWQPCRIVSKKLGQEERFVVELHESQGKLEVRGEKVISFSGELQKATISS
jgi:hypothetical protein